jgi:hypothetical protein
LFDIDIAGMCEIEGGKPSYRLAFEPVANVFDEYRRHEPVPLAEGEERSRAIDLGDAPKRPTWCRVRLCYSHDAPRGVWLTVVDDGPGFANEKDIYTLFGSTAKRRDPRVAGRFNMGEKQLIAVARKAIVCSGRVSVSFERGERSIQHHRIPYGETTVSALMPWSTIDMDTTRTWLKLLRAPTGLRYFIDDEEYGNNHSDLRVEVLLPTIDLVDGVLKERKRRTFVEVFTPAPDTKPMLYELGIPICELSDFGFPKSLDVQQKIPLPTSRDQVTTAYLYRLIGSVLQEAAADGHSLLSDAEEGAPFIKGALEWVHDARALAATVNDIYGEAAVRVSGDSTANARAVASGAPLISGREFGPETRRRMGEFSILRTARDVYGDPAPPAVRTAMGTNVCPACRRPY